MSENLQLLYKVKYTLTESRFNLGEDNRVLSVECISDIPRGFKQYVKKEIRPSESVRLNKSIIKKGSIIVQEFVPNCNNRVYYKFFLQ
jgi:hypothetical protein